MNHEQNQLVLSPKAVHMSKKNTATKPTALPRDSSLFARFRFDNAPSRDNLMSNREPVQQQLWFLVQRLFLPAPIPARSELTPIHRSNFKSLRTRSWGFLRFAN